MLEGRTPTYNEYLREQNAMDDLYSGFQKRTGLSDAEFWCLFSVYQGECAYQHEISAHMFMSKQTVNSALKHLVRKGLIEMRIPKENQRIREIVLTEKGKVFSDAHLNALDELGEKAWNSLSGQERSVMVEGMRKINRVLSDALQAK